MIVFLLAFGLGQPIRAQVPYLVEDLNLGWGAEPGVGGWSLVEHQGLGYFIGATPSDGFELWVTDGSTAGTSPFYSFFPGGCSGLDVSLPRHQSLHVFFDHLVFFACDPSLGWELWTSDGTAAGTQPVADAFPGPGAYYGNLFAESSGMLYYEFNHQLWRTDLTAAGTEMVLDVEIKELTATDEWIFFRGADDLLYRSSGTPGDQLHWSGFDSVEELTVLQDRLYFVGNDGYIGSELFVTDGTFDGTHVVADVATGYSSSSPCNLTVCNDRLFFSASTVVGRELWMTDGTEAGTVMVKDVNPAGDGMQMSSPIWTAGSWVYFSANDGDGTDNFWVTDGSESQTFSLPLGDGYAFSALPFEDDLIFLIRTGAQAEWWKTDGTVEGTELLADGFRSNDIELVGQLGNGCYARAFDEHGWELWKTDGTPAGTGIFTDPGAETGTLVSQVLNHDGHLVMVCPFQDASGEWADSLWSSRGWWSNTSQWFEVPNPVDAFSLLGHLWVFGEFFSVFPYYGFGELDLGSTDWTLRGRLSRSRAEFAAFLDDLIIMEQNDEFLCGLHRYDPDTQHMALLHEFDDPGAYELKPGGFCEVNDRLFFRARINVDDDREGTELWAIHPDGLGVSRVADIVEGSASSNPDDLVAMGDWLIFIADHPDFGRELWRSDGTELGTELVMDILPGPDDESEPEYLTPVSGKVFFVADDHVAGRELWSTDGTEAGTAVVRDIWPGDISGLYWTSGLVVLGSQVFFAASDGIFGNELWVTDGTEGGTVQVKDINPGLRSSHPMNLTAAGSLLYFTADDGLHGRELWVSDGTEAGTGLVADIFPGLPSSQPSMLQAVDSTLFFFADDGVHDRELWALRQSPNAEIHVDPTLCAGQGGYTAWVEDPSPLATYAWSISGGTIDAGGGTPSISFSSGLEIETELQVTVTLLGVASQTSITLPVQGGIPSGIGPISGPEQVCAFADPVIYSIPEPGPHVTCTWSAPPDAEILSGQGTPEVVVKFGSSGGTLSVVASNACGESMPEEMTIDCLAPVPQAYAGDDQVACGTDTVLAATPVTTGSGAWHILSGSGGSLDHASDPESGFSGLAGEIYELEWVVSHPPCGESRDRVIIVFHQSPPPALAGSDQVICSLNTTLEGNDPGIGSGLWRILSGEGGELSQPWNPNTSFSGLPGQQYVLEWHISAPPCGETWDQVEIFLNALDGHAGDDQCVVAGESARLQGHAVNGTGTWELLSGPSLDPTQLSDPGDPQALFTPSGGVGTYTLQWTVANAFCSPVTDSVTISVCDDTFDSQASSGLSTTSRLSPSSNPQGGFSFQGLFFFTAEDGFHGREWWITDGTPEGTQLFADLLGLGSASPAEMHMAGDLLFFSASGDGVARELWISDGTPEGTRVVTDALIDLNPQSLTPIGDRVFFGGWDQAHGRELWISDGTPNGTHLLRDLEIASNQAPRYLTAFEGQLFFEAGGRLHISDGTPIGTHDVESASSIYAPMLNGPPFAFNGVLYFDGGKLYRTDGTKPGTYQVGDVVCSGGFAELAGHLFFCSGSGSHRELWRTDGTDQGTVHIKDVPNMTLEMLAFDGGLFFFDDQGLWRSDGTGIGTARLAFCEAGQGMVAYEGKVYFSAASVDNGTELWVSDGTTQGTEMLADLVPGTGSSSPVILGVHDGRLLFSGRHPDLGVELWSTDGTAGNTSVLKDIHREYPLETMDEVTVAGSMLLFEKDDDGAGQEPFVVSGPGQPAHLLKDIDPGSSGSEPKEFFPLGDHVFFSADSPAGRELWATDGSEAGTFMVRDIRPGSGSSDPARFTAAGGGVVFWAEEVYPNMSLWYSDGTTDGTFRLAEFGDQVYASITSWNGVAFFWVRNASYRWELWRSDGTPAGTTLLNVPCPNTSSSDHAFLGAGSSYLYFQFQDSSYEQNIWRTDGTSGGTFDLMDPNLSWTTAHTAVVGDRLFAIDDDDQLWVAEPMAPSLVLVGESIPQAKALTPVGGINDRLVFQVEHYEGYSLWVSDGTAGGTVQLIEMREGTSDWTSRCVPHQGLLYFSATTKACGRELWATDGSLMGTRMLGDIHPGPGSSAPDELLAVGDRVIFHATSPTHGRELWASDGQCCVRLTDHALGPRSGLFHTLTSSEQTFYYTVSAPEQDEELRGATLDAIRLPDPGLRSRVLAAFDANGDGRLSQIEADAIEILDLENANVSNLKGLESMPHLKVLLARGNAITNVRPLFGNPNLGHRSDDLIDLRHNQLDASDCYGINLLSQRGDISRGTLLLDPQNPNPHYAHFEFWPHQNVKDIVLVMEFEHNLDCAP